MSLYNEKNIFDVMTKIKNIKDDLTDTKMNLMINGSFHKAMCEIEEHMKCYEKSRNLSIMTRDDIMDQSNDRYVFDGVLTDDVKKRILTYIHNILTDLDFNVVWYGNVEHQLKEMNPEMYQLYAFERRLNI